MVTHTKHDQPYYHDCIFFTTTFANRFVFSCLSSTFLKRIISHVGISLNIGDCKTNIRQTWWIMFSFPLLMVASCEPPSFFPGDIPILAPLSSLHQEYLLEQQEAAEDALQSGKAPKEQTQSIQKLLENVINGANVDKVPGFSGDFGW